MNTVEILKAARGLLVGKGWTQGCSARDVFDLPLMSGDPGAVCYCGLGAIWAQPTLDYNHGAMKRSAEEALTRTVPYDFEAMESSDLPFADWQDAKGRTLLEVLAKFDEAIAAETVKLAA